MLYRYTYSITKLYSAHRFKDTTQYIIYYYPVQGRDVAGVTFFIQVARPGQNRSGHISGTRRESVQPATGRLGVVDIMHWPYEHMMISRPRGALDGDDRGITAGSLAAEAEGRHASVVAGVDTRDRTEAAQATGCQERLAHARTRRPQTAQPRRAPRVVRGNRRRTELDGAYRP